MLVCYLLGVEQCVFYCFLVEVWVLQQLFCYVLVQGCQCDVWVDGLDFDDYYQICFGVYVQLGVIYFGYVFVVVFYGVFLKLFCLV